MFRLGRSEEGRERPLLVKFSSEEKKKSIMSRVKELKMAPERFRRISKHMISHHIKGRSSKRIEGKHLMSWKVRRKGKMREQAVWETTELLW